LRLNKYLAQNLQISRRNADEKIAAGHVKINNEKASVGTIVNEHDVVEVDGQEIKSRTKHEYYKFYKPKGYICSHEKQGDSPLIFDPTNLSNGFTVVWAMDVSDPATYANGFVEFNNSTTGTFELHEAIIGAKDGVTHYFVARQSDLGAWLEAREGVFASGAVEQFQSVISGSADILFNVGFNLIKAYNTD